MVGSVVIILIVDEVLDGGAVVVLGCFVDVWVFEMDESDEGFADGVCAEFFACEAGFEQGGVAEGWPVDIAVDFCHFHMPDELSIMAEIDGVSFVQAFGEDASHFDGFEAAQY